MRSRPEVVKLLPDVQRNDQNLAVVNVASTLENPRHLKLCWKDELLERGDVLRLASGFFESVDLAQNFLEIARRENRESFPDTDAKLPRQLGADQRFAALEVIFSRDDKR